MHVTITAHLNSPVIGDVGPLDGPLAWAAHQLATVAHVDIPPITDEHLQDFDLPLHTWDRGDYWGWCVSSPIVSPIHHSSVEIRRKPAAGAMAMYTAAKEHHAGLGPTKARNVTLAATHYDTIQWYAHITDRPALEAHLSIITELGARHRNGFGHVAQWTIEDGPEDGWMHRPLPAADGQLMRVRAPYWHPTERTSCLQT